MDYLNIVISKGRVGDESFGLFKKAGIGSSIDLDSRKLIFKDEKNKLNFIYVKSGDVLTYVERGFADLGIVGKDVILESEADIFELLDLGLGKCKFVIAGLSESGLCIKEGVKVATKYPKVTKEYFERRNQRIKIVKLDGSIELAPILGLSDIIVDLFQTGSTLKANNLKVIEEMFDISTRLISNRISYRFKKDRINELVELLKGEKR